MLRNLLLFHSANQLHKPLSIKSMYLIKLKQKKESEKINNSRRWTSADRISKIQLVKPFQSQESSKNQFKHFWKPIEWPIILQSNSVLWCCFVFFLWFLDPFYVEYFLLAAYHFSRSYPPKTINKWGFYIRELGQQ